MRAAREAAPDAPPELCAICEKAMALHPDYFDGFWVDCKGCHTGGPTPAVEGKCASCHPERVSGLNQEMPTTKVAIHRSCWSCHDRGTGASATKQCGFCHQRPASPRAAPAGAAATK